MATGRTEQLTFWDLGKQQVTVDFQAGQVVCDAGLLPLRQLDKDLSVLATVAQRLPDPRAQAFVTHTAEALLVQEVYQILAGYPDGNDAQALRQDPLFQTLVGGCPDGAAALASGSTLNRFHHAYTGVTPNCRPKSGRCWARSRPLAAGVYAFSMITCPSCSSARGGSHRPL